MTTNTNQTLLRWKEILKMAWPLILANSFWNLQLTIDRIFLGMLSTEALGAAMAVMGIFWVPMALLQGTANYVMTFVAQYFGANEKEKIGAALWQSIYISIFGGISFLGLIFLSPAFFKMVGHSESIQVFEVEYFNSLAFCALPTALVAAISGFFTGLGETKVVYKLNFVGLVANAILDYVLIFGHFGFPKMGVAGAGYATAIATLLSALFGIYLVYKPKIHQDLYRVISDWKLNLDLIKQYLKFGFPSGLQWALEGLAFTVFLIIVGLFPNPEASLAASSIAVTIMMLSVLPTMGIGQALMTLMGQYLGAKTPDKAELAVKDGIKISQIYMAFIAVTFFLIPEFYISWFKNEENAMLWTTVNEMTIKLLRIVAVFTILDSFYLNISFALKGAGDTKFVSLIALLLPWPLMVVPTYLLKDSSDPVIYSWMSCAGYSMITALVMYWRFKQGKWKTMSVIHS